ncbi:similar to An01g11330 [Aspergillus luchuensis]|uniref:Similar to An01g11330 n=1 Tax=Aspergillus kawachii TaxID=1069201 RepID=A0A146FBP0_ASPKA|nr:similar to An01g11330 [Aspergillus luchuensis IFO 4308]GAT23325.1 similar to An01g11330 [Aspergillus luchuensis]
MGFEYERVTNARSDPELATPKDAGDEEDEALLQPNKTNTNNNSCPKYHPSYLINHIKALLLSTPNLAHTLILSIIPTNTHPPTPNTCHCGNSTTEALTLGCKFDSLAAAWLPPHCRDDELTAEFERAGPNPDGSWTYYADDYHTVPMAIEEVAALADNQSARVQMTRDWHVVHCLFYWRKMFRVRDLEGVIVEPSFDHEEHIKHCIGVVLEDSWGTEARVALDT